MTMGSEQYQLITLPNGLRIVHQRVKGTQLVHAGFSIQAGSKNDGAHPGLAHCLEHMLFKGTTRRKTIHVLNHLEVVGGELNAYTTKEITTIYGTTQSKHLTRLTDILCDVVFRSTFPEGELEKEKKVIIDEINMYLDTPEENIFDEFQERIFAGHPLAHNILGTEESVNEISQTALKNFVSTHYQFHNMVFAVVGNVSIERVLSALNRFLPDAGELSSTPINQQELSPKSNQPIAVLGDLQNGVGAATAFKSASPFIETKKTDFNQAYAIIGSLAYEMDHEKRWTLLLMNNFFGGPVLNSRLNLAIREKYGYTYNVESGYSGFAETGLFHCFVGSEPKYIQKSVDLIFKEIKKLRTQSLGTLQLSRAKNQYAGQLILSNENRSGLMMHLGQSVLRKGKANSIEHAIDCINRVTVQNIMDVANELLNENQFSQLLYVPEND
jgi:predicted Zn-dependent peptidase